MRTVKQLAVPQNTESKFPFGTIQNETDVQSGTPVIEELYGDILTNIYKLLQTVGITPTATQDSDSSQYQILEALKLLPNTLNDIEQVLSLAATTWNIPFNLDLLPNKYFFVARASENYVAGTTYSFKGSTTTEYQFTSNGFKASDELLVIIDQGTVRAYSLSSLGSSSSEVFAVMGTPLAFNDTNKMWYQEEGKMMSDVPSVDYLESVIRVDLSDGTVLVQDILVMNGYVVCFCIIPSTNVYFFRQFSLSDFSVSYAIALAGTSFGTASDFAPYVYAKSGGVYVTNGMNTSANDYSISNLNYNPTLATLTLASSLSLDNSFTKTTNAVVKSDNIYTFVSGVLESFSLSSGAKTSLGTYSGVSGQIFGFNGEIYFTGGEVAKKWF